MTAAYEENHENAKFAEKLVGIMELEMLEKIQPSDFRELISEQMLGFMEEILENELGEIDGKEEKLSDKDWWAKYELRMRKAAKTRNVTKSFTRARNGERKQILFGSMKSCRDELYGGT